MADEREISIVIKGQNLSAEAFQKAREQIAGLKKPLDDSNKSGETFAQQFLGAKNATSLFSDQVKSLVAGFTIASMIEKAAGAIVGWTHELYDNADALVKQSDKTGINIETLERYQVVAKRSGVDQNSLIDGSYKLGLAMQAGSDDTKKALNAIGLSYDDLRSKSPEQQFDAVMRALEKTTDVSQRNYLGTLLIGRAYAEIAPAVKGFGAGMDSISVSSEAAIRALHDQSEAIDRQTQSWKNWWTGVFGNWAQAREQVGMLTAEQQQAWQAIVKSGGDGHAYLLKLSNERIEADRKAAKEAADSSKVQQQATTDFNAVLAAARDEVAHLSAEKRSQIEAAQAMSKSDKEVADQLHISESAVKLYKDQLADSKKKTDEAKQATEAYKKEVSGLADQFTGRKLAQEIKKVSDGFEAAGGASKMNAVEVKDLTGKLSDYIAKGGELTPVLFDFWQAHVNLSEKVLPATNESLLKLVDSVGRYGAKVQSVVPPLAPIIQASLDDILQHNKLDLAKVEVKLPLFDAGLKGALEIGMRNAVNQIASAPSLGVAAGVLGASMADQIGAFFATQEGAGPMSKGFGLALQLASKQPSLASAITSFAGSMAATLGSEVGGALGGPLGSAIGGALGSFVGPVLNHFFGTAGRDAVETFGAQFGGLDNLHKKLGEVFDSATAERYWISLTQGVGKNNPAEAKRIIDEITAAMADQQSTIDGMVPTWKQAIEIATSYGGTVDQLGPRFQQQQLSERALQLVTDMKKLQAAGADVNDIMGFMGDEFQDVITQALKYGVEVPEKMRPVAEAMLAQGKLTDENGEKLTDLSRLSWSTTVTEQFSKLIDKLDKFIDKLTTGVGAAAQTAAQQAQAALGDLAFDIPVNLNVVSHGDGGGSSEDGWTGPQYASGGMAEGRQVALLAERGRREIVGDQSFMTNALVGALDRIGSSPIQAAISGGNGDGFSALLKPILTELQMLRLQKAGDVVLQQTTAIDGQVQDQRVVRLVREALIDGRILVPQQSVRLRVAG